MTSSINGARTREPVHSGTSRIRGLWQRTLASGRIVYDSQLRENGKMRRVRHPDGLNKTEAILAHRKLVGGVAEGELQIGDRSLTVRQLCESFMEREDGPLGTRSASTRELYRSRLDLHVLPALGSLKAVDVRVEHVRKFKDLLVARGFSGSLVSHCLAVLGASYAHGAMHLNQGLRNPVRDLERGERPSKKRRSEPRYLDVAEVRALLDALSDETRPIAAVMFYAGLRVSEALDLTWADVDFEQKTLAAPGTKTDGSRAIVPLLDPLAVELRVHRARQLKLGIQRGTLEALVFQTAAGGHVKRHNVLRAIKAAAGPLGLNREGLKPVGCHTLRHSLAANAFALNATTPEVARLLRHSTPAVTMSTYAGLSDSAVASLGERLAGLG